MHSYFNVVYFVACMVTALVNSYGWVFTLHHSVLYGIEERRLRSLKYEEKIAYVEEKI